MHGVFEMLCVSKYYNLNSVEEVHFVNRICFSKVCSLLTILSFVLLQTKPYKRQNSTILHLEFVSL